MVRTRRKSLPDEQREKKKEAVTIEDDSEEEDDEGLDEFEIDGFIVDNVGDENEDDKEEADPKQTQKKKKKRRRLLKNVLDSDDLELIRENASINQGNLEDGKFKRLKKVGKDTSDDGGSFFDDIIEEYESVSNDSDDDMEGFIVDEEVVYGKGESLRQRKFKDTKQSSSLPKEAKYGYGTEPDDPNKYESFIPTSTDITGESNCVDDTDIPERMKIIEDIVGSVPVDRMSIEEESFWILSQLAFNMNPMFSEAESCRLVETLKREDIVRFLELHHTEKYDIPFIAMYRKEQCLSLLEDQKQDESENILNDIERKPKLKWHKILWAIKELDKKWMLLQKRKNTLMRYYNKYFEEEFQMSFPDEESSFRKQIFESITNMLKKAETEREIDDIDMKFNLHFPPAEEFFDSGYKRPMMKSYYSNCSKAGLWTLACKFGNPEKFDSLVTLEKVGMDNEEDPEESPEGTASIYKCETFENLEAVLRGARHMAAVLLSSGICFKKYVRKIFMDKALVSTSPTVEGNIAVDSFHEFAGVKWLRDKPLSKFEDSQWLFIQKAEEEKLLQVTIKLPDHALNELTMTCNDAYLKNSEGTSARLWNEQRKLILQDAMSNFLLPSMEKEARALLNAKAKCWLLMEYGRHLWNRVSVGPYQNKGNGTAQEQGVMACCWGNGKPGTTFVMLDSRGELVDVMHAGSLTLRSQNMNDQQRRKSDQIRVLKFLTIYQPHVIVLGAANASCIRLRDDINEIISMMSEDKFQDFGQKMKGPPAVVLGDEGLPRLYEVSEISMNQLPKQHGIVKRAVALGRYLLNPLAMIATLCGVKKEVVSWKLYPQEKLLTSDEKLEIIEWVMTDITNQVGIDINLAIRHEWLLAPLQFISGLGPQKAGILYRELLGGQDLRNRRDFTKFGLNTKKVFFNAVGFLQVSCDDPFFVDTVGNILDRTRIHPESYYLAEELARAVHRHILENPDANVTEVNAIEYIHNDPKLLECFDLNEYADRLENEKGECRRVTLFDIKMELLHAFNDPRRPYEEPTQDEEFYMITGETGDVIDEGRRVQAIVRHVQPQQAFCMLDCGMTGVLSKDDFSDETENISLTDKLHEGVVLTCKIKLIDKNRCRVNLTCKASELKNDDEQSFHDMDPYYSQGNIILPSQLEAVHKKELGNKPFMPRMISHPHFQNITADQAKEFLADKAVGEYIFHPSSKGPFYLTLSLKIFCGLYVHKDIVEGGKKPGVKSLLGLGETLKVGEEIFEDIDKVIEHYVNPLVVHLKAMIDFRKFKKGTKAEVDELLKLEKEEYPKRIPYGFGISYEHTGTFILSYIRSANPRHEFIGIHPKGFKFRKQIFKNIEQLVAYFQNHIHDNVAPAKNRTTDGSFKESMSGGWRSSNVDQQKQSAGYNDRGGGRGGRGFDRGRRGGRGRGFGARSGSRDDRDSDVKDDSGFASSKWGLGSSDATDNSFAAGKSWGVGGSGEGNGSGWRHGSGEVGGRGMRGGHEREQSSLDGGWDSIGTVHNNDGGTGWANANSSGWKDNIGKSWGEGGPGEGSGGGSGSKNFSQQNRHESGWHSGGSNRGFSNDCGEGQGEGRGRGRGRRGRGSQGDGQGRGSENDMNRDSYSGKWGGGGSDHSGSGGWTNANSSGWKDNIGKSWGGPGEGSGGNDHSGSGGWTNANSSGLKDNIGKSWGGPGEGSSGNDHSGSGGWTNANSSDSKDNIDKSWGAPGGGSGGNDHSESGGWTNANSSGLKDNIGKSWGGPGEGSSGNDHSGSGGWTNANSSDSKDNIDKSWGAPGGGSGGNDHSESGGWTNAKSSGLKDNIGKSWGGPGEGSGGNDHSGSGGWTNAKSSGSKDSIGKSWGGPGKGSGGGSDHSGSGGWKNANSSGWKDNIGKSWGGCGEGSGGGSDHSGSGGWKNSNSSGSKDNIGKSWGGPGQGSDGGSDHSGSGGWKNANSSGWKDNVGKSWGGRGEGSGGGSDRSGSGGWKNSNSSGSKDNIGKSWDGPGQGSDGGSDHSGSGGWKNANSSGWKDNIGKSRGGPGEGNGGSDHSGSGGWTNANSSGWKDNPGKNWGGAGEGSGGGSDHSGSGGWKNANSSGSHRDASNDSGWGRGQREGRGRGSGRGWRGSQGDGQGRGRWGGNSADE